MNEMRELNDAELEAVSGGMECNTALVLSRFYRSLGEAYGMMGGFQQTSAYFYGMAEGVAQGGCD